MPELHKKNINQKHRGQSPWTLKEKLKIRLWHVTWVLLIKWLPKHPFNAWRLFLLRLFGAKISGRSFIYPTCKIYAPWLLSIEKGSCLGPNTELYNLGQIDIGKNVTVSAYTLICNGSHDISDSELPLTVGHIKICDNVFIGMKVLVLPGINLGEYSVIGAGSVVTKDILPYDIVGGNPARVIGKREIKK